MTNYQVLALGAFIIAGAHYVRNGDDNWYAVWVLAGVFHVCFGAWLAPKPTMTSGHSVEGKP